MIPDSFVQELLARVDVVDIVGRYVQLRKGGANLLGLCPFHNEKSPSFTVSPSKQFYHCFGCGAHGTAITFLMEHTGATFPEAVRNLASGVGMTVPDDTPRSPRQRAADKRRKEEVSRHQQLLDRAQAHYAHSLKSAPSAISYLKKRGLTGETAARFGLGWSGTDRRGLASVFENYEDPLLVEAGLVIESEDGRRYDRFRERIMFPIRNHRGNLIGFGGRIVGKGEPKYLNSPETPLFSKGHELYGLWENRTGIRDEGCVLVVEGYMDVVGLAHHGLNNAVATLGTATTSFHIQKLMRASHRIVFSFDGDKAGRKAAWRALETCLPLVRDDVAIRFLFLPAEHDPDSYIAEYGAPAFRATLAEAIPLSRFLLDELASRHRMDEPEGRAACVHEAKPLLALLPEGTFRLQMEREFAKMALLTPEELAQMLEAMPESRPDPRMQVGRRQELEQNRAHPGHARPDMGAAFSDEPPGFMDVPHFDEGGGGYIPESMEFLSDEPQHADSSAMDRARSPRLGDKAKWRDSKRTFTRPGAMPKTRAVTPMAKRLLKLLVAHPGLADHLSAQQLEILHAGPHLSLVRDLISLILDSNARHAGALLQAAQPDSDLAHVLEPIVGEVMDQEELPDPQAEWNDALKRIELDAVKQEQSALIAAGLQDEASRKRYQELTRRIALLK